MTSRINSNASCSFIPHVYVGAGGVRWQLPRPKREGPVTVQWESSVRGSRLKVSTQVDPCTVVFIFVLTG